MISFVSCANSIQENDSAEEVPTLRYTAEKLYEATVWTEEVEVDRLTAQVSAVEGISSRLNLSPLIVLASVLSEDSRIFPSLASFGSLDTTLISPSLREMLSSFSEAISYYKDADSFFIRENLYSLALFYTDFRRIFSTCFDLTEPEATESAEENTGEKSEGEAQGEEKKSERLETKCFSSFVLGQPFLDGVFYEVPVKFFSEKATLTLSVFCVENEGAWKVDQVQIADWEIF